MFCTGRDRPMKGEDLSEMLEALIKQAGALWKDWK
jgi:hypothetical protein